VTKRSSEKTNKNKNSKKKNVPSNEPWIPTRGGLIILAIASLSLTVWVTWQGLKVGTFGESLLWGLAFGASIWMIFGIVFAINRFLRGR
jgi:hypothetical protein